MRNRKKAGIKGSGCRVRVMTGLLSRPTPSPESVWIEGLSEEAVKPLLPPPPPSSSLSSPPLSATMDQICIPPLSDWYSRTYCSCHTVILLIFCWMEARVGSWLTKLQMVQQVFKPVEGWPKKKSTPTKIPGHQRTAGNSGIVCRFKYLDLDRSKEMDEKWNRI